MTFVTPNKPISLEVHTGTLSVICNGRTLATRSRALLVFVSALVRQKRDLPNTPWIGIDALREVLPSVHGKQMQRFVDALAEIGFPIEYESKTRGRYCLAVLAEQVRFDVDEAALDAFMGMRETAGARPIPIRQTECRYLVSRHPGRTDNSPPDPGIKPNRPAEESDHFLVSLSQMLLADSQFHDGNLNNGADHAYEIWRKQAETATAELKAIALLKLARVCRRLQRYGEAQEALRHLRRMVRNGAIVNEPLLIKARLCLAMLRYEQGRLDEARVIVEKLDMRCCADDATLGEFYNLRGLLAGGDLRRCHKQGLISGTTPDPEALSALLTIGTHYFRQALTMMVNNNDYQAMQSTCFNLGNLYLYAYRTKLPLAARAELLGYGIGWIAQCEFICSKFGVGMDAAWSKIVLLQAALDAGLTLGALNRLTDNLFRGQVDLESVAQSTLAETVRIGSLVEQGATLEILAEFARRRGDLKGVANYRDRALAIYRTLNRPDLIRQLKKGFPAKGALS